MANLIKYYQTLFDPGDKICLGRTKYDTAIRPLRFVGKDEQFVSINPLKGTRADANVTKYRNILLEFDKISLDEQLKIIKSVPYSTLTFSGGKSYHAIISLATPLPSEDEYRLVVKTLYNKLKEHGPDNANINPSRFTRAPEAIRDTGAVQRLIAAPGRIDNEEFFQWLGPIEREEPVVKAFKINKVIPISVYSFIKYGVTENRNINLFINACKLFECGFDLNEVEQLLKDATDLSKKEITATIRSAYRKIKRTSRK